MNIDSQGLVNIITVWNQVDDVDREEGILAFPRYRNTLDRLAKHYNFPLMSVVGAFCALSPNNSYMVNLKATVGLMRGDEKVAGYPDCRKRALRCLHGENFETFTKGKKTLNFYKNIMNPADPEPVTVDGHAYCVWAGKRYTMKEVVRLKFKYDEVAEGYRIMARHYGLLPCQFQAILWFTWKRINKVIYKEQMGLFFTGDQWRLDLHPEEI